jgi:hypothetical protein
MGVVDDSSFGFGGLLPLPILWFGAKDVMTICREPQRSHRNRSFTLTRG